MNPPGESLTQLILTESENDRVKWVNALQQLHKALKENKETSKTVNTFLKTYTGVFSVIVRL